MARTDFDLEVLKMGIVARHRDGHVLSYFRPEKPSMKLAEHMRYCHPPNDASFVCFAEEAQHAAHEVALSLGWIRAPS